MMDLQKARLPLQNNPAFAAAVVVAVVVVAVGGGGLACPPQVSFLRGPVRDQASLLHGSIIELENLGQRRREDRMD